MVGFRRESFYVEKYGEEMGKQKYKKVTEQRLARTTRRSIETSLDDSAVINGDAIKCCACGKIFKRITRTHLKNTCIVSITPEEYKIKYPNSEIIAKNLTKLFSNTEKSTIEKYGEEVGIVKWKNYQDIQAETNTFEYKAKKYNMSKEEFDSYNKERSCTLENFIQRHGEDIGIDMWDKYCDRQRYTITLNYFTEKYGEETGKQKFDKFCLSRNLTDKKQSELEISIYDELKLLIDRLDISIRLDNLYFGPFDFGNKEKKKLIEFYGTYWHTDPRVYDDNFYHLQRRLTAKQIKSRDQAKRTYAQNSGYDVFVLWEYDWKKNKAMIIENLKRFWDEN
jgi:G:T-mismatch repair DNA endonuclease (very short patch repair protein)